MNPIATYRSPQGRLRLIYSRGDGFVWGHQDMQRPESIGPLCRADEFHEVVGNDSMRLDLLGHRAGRTMRFFERVGNRYVRRGVKRPRYYRHPAGAVPE